MSSGVSSCTLMMQPPLFSRKAKSRKPAFPESSGRKSPYMLVEVEAQYLYEDFLYELENGLLCLFVFDKAE